MSQAELIWMYCSTTQFKTTKIAKLCKCSVAEVFRVSMLRGKA